MTISPAVSVIIPMYNAENYIAQCLESIFMQTLQDFEVIVVDDCSTDNSCAVGESYVEKFGGRLKLIHTEENSGSGALPRNRGLMLSRGEYVFFADADDLFTQTALEELFSLAKNFDADVIYCEKYYEADANLKNIWLVTQDKNNFVDKPMFETNDLAERTNKIISSKFHGVPWRKFVRRDFLIEHEITFPHCRISEDELWTYALIFCAGKFLYVPNAIYIRRLAENSVIRKKRTPQQEINFWLNPLVYALKDFDALMNKIEFFKQNPIYHCALLENFIHTRFSCVFEASHKLQLSEIYDSIRKEFGNKFGEYDVLISFLLSDLIAQQKLFVKMKEQIANLEKNK